MATVTINIGAYAAASLYTSIDLAFYPDDNVCDKTKTAYKINTPTFEAGSLIYTTAEAVAPVGWYSNGTNKAYWNGTILSSYSACVLIGLTFNSYTGTDANFTITGGAISALNLLSSVDAGITWTSTPISSTSPVTGLTTPTVETLVKLQSVDNPLLISNILLYQLNFNINASPGYGSVMIFGYDYEVNRAKHSYDVENPINIVGQELDSGMYKASRFYVNFDSIVTATPSQVNLKVHTSSAFISLIASRADHFDISTNNNVNANFGSFGIFEGYPYTNAPVMGAANAYITIPLNEVAILELLGQGYLDIALLTNDDYEGYILSVDESILTIVNTTSYPPYLEIIF